MSHRGALIVRRNLLGIGSGPHGRMKMSLRGLGADETSDYSIETRRAALAREQRDRMNRLYDQQDSAMRAAERERVLQIAQEAVQKSYVSQTNLLTSGQNQMRRLLTAGGAIAMVSLIALTVSAAIVKPETSKSRSGKGRRRSRSRRRSRKPTTMSSPISLPSSLGGAA